MDSFDSVDSIYNKNNEINIYYDNENGAYERARDNEKSINDLLLNESKKKPQKFLFHYFLIFIILSVSITLIIYFVLHDINII